MTKRREWALYALAGALCGYLMTAGLFANNRLVFHSLFFAKVTLLLSITYATIGLCGGVAVTLIWRTVHGAWSRSRFRAAEPVAVRLSLFVGGTVFVALFFWHFDSFYHYSTFGFARLISVLITESFNPVSADGPGNLIHIFGLLLVAMAAGTVFYAARVHLERSGWARPVGRGSFLAVLVLPWLLQLSWSTSVPDEDTTLLAQPGRKVLIIAVDALDWKMTQEFVEQGYIPNIARLSRQGFSAPLETFKPAYSPMVWTSLATGRSPAIHNIRHFHGYAANSHTAIQPLVEPSLLLGNPYVLKLLAQAGFLQRRSVTGNTRHVPALWEITSRANLFTVILGWWATTPAEPLKGILVSDYATHTDGTPGALAPHVYPSDEIAEISSDLSKGRLPTDHWIRKLFGLTDAEAEVVHRGDLAQMTEIEMHEVMRSMYHDQSMFAIANRLIEEEQPDVLAVYLEGIDTAGHTTLSFGRGQDPTKLDSVKTRHYRNTHRVYYQIVDDMIGRLTDAVDENTHIVIVSDHGFRLESQPNYFHHKTGPPGVLVLNGPGIEQSLPSASAHILDFLPTLLYILGLPVAADMEGRVIDEAFTLEFSNKYKPKETASYNYLRADQYLDNHVAPGGGSGEKMVDRLKALGYIE